MTTEQPVPGDDGPVESQPAPDPEQVRRRRVLLAVSALGALGVIAAVVLAFVVNDGSSTKSAPIAHNRQSAYSSILDPVSSVPAATLDAVGLGSTSGAPHPVTGAPLTRNGKPELLFIGAEFCPYCAGERWSIAVALSRFGRLEHVTLTQSSSADVDPNTRTLDFLQTTYTSDYLAFVPVEAEDRNQQPLARPTAAQNQLWNKYSGNRPGYPFLDFGNSLVELGPTFDPGVLAGLSQQQIADKLKDANDPVAKSVDGAANVLTAAICHLTQDQPASVCSDPMISGLESQLVGNAAT